MSELLAALKRNLVNASGREAAVIRARIDAIENPTIAEATVADDPSDDSEDAPSPDPHTFDGPDPYPPLTIPDDSEEE